MRYTNASGDFSGACCSDRLIFYSDNAEGVSAPADTGFPSNIGTSISIFSVVERDGIIDYEDLFPFLTAISDEGVTAVPEPATLTLLGTALLGMGARRWRTRRQRG